MVESYCGDYSTNFLEGLVIMEDPKYGYSDPDDGYKIEGNEYYTNIVKFLKKREEDVLSGKWEYEVVKDKGIEVKEGNERIFYLRSDQFGFSAPQISTSTRFLGCDNKYPYWRYLHLSTRGSKYWKVIEWINNTRTIGGSFVWPVWQENKKSDYYSRYNRYRGVKSYIEDSVDLTLYEVKHYYDWKNKDKEKDIIKDEYNYKDDVLYKTEFEPFIKEKDKRCPMRKWLDHFETFEQYVTFFRFDKFVCKKNGGLVPIDLVDGKALTEDKVEGKDDILGYRKKRRFNNSDVDDKLEEILNRLSDMTLMRTARMLEVINNSESSQS